MNAKASPKKVNIENYTAGAEIDPAIAEMEQDVDAALLNLTNLDEVVAEPDLPGFAVSDEPLPPPSPPVAENEFLRENAPGYSGLINSLAQGHESFTDARNDMARRANEPGPQPASDELFGDIIPPDTDPTHVKYESRIRILEAWQYNGGVAEAPEFIDRNWVGWSDYDAVRQMEPGPCLRVPIEGTSTVTICRPGDYVVRQETLLQPGMPTDEKREVWEKNQFQRLFIPSLVETREVDGPDDQDVP